MKRNEKVSKKMGEITDAENKNIKIQKR